MDKLKKDIENKFKQYGFKIFNTHKEHHIKFNDWINLILQILINSKSILIISMDNDFDKEILSKFNLNNLSEKKHIISIFMNENNLLCSFSNSINTYDGWFNPIKSREFCGICCERKYLFMMCSICENICCQKCIKKLEKSQCPYCSYSLKEHIDKTSCLIGLAI
jgi:hypothetical protein